jgi:hypothetical protein
MRASDAYAHNRAARLSPLCALPSAGYFGLASRARCPITHLLGDPLSPKLSLGNRTPNPLRMNRHVCPRKNYSRVSVPRVYNIHNNVSFGHLGPGPCHLQAGHIHHLKESREPIDLGVTFAPDNHQACLTNFCHPNNKR